MHRIKTLASALVVALVVIAALDYTASAATGGKFILGQLNKAGKQTVLKRTKPGPALGLTTKSSSNAPFTTNATGKVANLNADKLDGMDSVTLGTRAYAAVNGNGTISPKDGTDPVGGSAFNLPQSSETSHTNAGTYCFHPSFVPQSAMVSAMGDVGLADSFFTVATVTVRTHKNLSGCGVNDTVRVRTYSIPSGATYAPPALTDEPFILWIK